jgi:hypothetical protein
LKGARVIISRLTMLILKSKPHDIGEGRVAVTPMGKDPRMGGTMEIAGLDDKIRTSVWREFYLPLKSTCRTTPSQKQKL